MAFKMKGYSYPGTSPMRNNGLAITLGGTGIKTGIKNDKVYKSATINPGVRIGNLNLGYEYGAKRTGGRTGTGKKIKNITGDYRFVNNKCLTGSLSGKLGTNKSLSGILGFYTNPYQSK